MKNLTALTILLSCSSILYGQAHYEFLTTKANSVEIVIEGKVTNKRVYYDTDLKFYLTEYEVEVFRQFKGVIATKVYFYINGGIDESGKGQRFPHSPSVSLGRVGVFFLKYYMPYEKPYLMPSGDNSIMRYDFLGNRVRAYVYGYEYNDLIREIYTPLEKCTGCYNNKIKNQEDGH